MASLRHDLEAAGRTDARVGRVLQFYADRLSVPGRMLVAIVSLFSRPVGVTTVLAIGDSEAVGRPISGWTAAGVEEIARGRLAGLLTWHPEGLVSAHPLVRGAFRPLILTGDTARLASDVALADRQRRGEGPVGWQRRRAAVRLRRSAGVGAPPAARAAAPGPLASGPAAHQARLAPSANQFCGIGPGIVTPARQTWPGNHPPVRQGPGRCDSSRPARSPP